MRNNTTVALAAAVAGKFPQLGSALPITTRGAAQVVRNLNECANQAARIMPEVTLLKVDTSPVPAMIVSRRQWAEINAQAIGTLFDSVPEIVHLRSGKKSDLSNVAQAVSGGIALGYFSRKILGQYEIFSQDPGKLLLVAPTIDTIGRQINVPAIPFYRWICAHEVTHQLQFTAVPWLRTYVLDNIATVLSTLSDESRMISLVRREMPELRTLENIMTLLEGHADYMMDAALAADGPWPTPEVDQLRAAHQARRNNRNALEKMLGQILGMERKYRQYTQGRHFVSQIIDAIGVTGFNQVWQSPSTLPTRQEIMQPRLWIDRLNGSVTTN